METVKPEEQLSITTRKVQARGFSTYSAMTLPGDPARCLHVDGDEAVGGVMN